MATHTYITTADEEACIQKCVDKVNAERTAINDRNAETEDYVPLEMETTTTYMSARIGEVVASYCDQVMRDDEAALLADFRAADSAKKTEAMAALK